MKRILTDVLLGVHIPISLHSNFVQGRWFPLLLHNLLLDLRHRKDKLCRKHVPRTHALLQYLIHPGMQLHALGLCKL